MIFYIVLLTSQIVVRCMEATGCTQISYAHFTYLISGGFLELLFEVPYAMKIYKRTIAKNPKNSEGEKNANSDT